MKLYEVPRDSKIKVLKDAVVPPSAPRIKEGDILDFKNIDGMYSLCYKYGAPVHIAAWTEVEMI
jgi:hypothetical protein